MAQRQNSKADAEIDRNLKQAFEELAEEPVPQRFAELLQRLRNGEQRTGALTLPLSNDD
jgi:predicted N-acetyltransferase YhbS